jgi:hypothetical protein
MMCGTSPRELEEGVPDSLAKSKKEAFQAVLFDRLWRQQRAKLSRSLSANNTEATSPRVPGSGAVTLSISN